MGRWVPFIRQGVMSALMQNPKQKGILIVDDDPFFTYALKEFFQDHGYSKILTADSGEKALSILAAHSDEIYVIILDLAMPEMDGLTVIRHLIRAHGIHVGILIVSGHCTLEKAVEITALQKASTDKVFIIEFIAKPMDSHTVLSSVERALEVVDKARIENRVDAK